MRSAWQWVGAFALWGYAALVAVIALPTIIDRSTFWQFSVAFLAIVGVPTIVLGALLLIPRIARVIAIMAALWMAFAAWSLELSGPLGLVALVVAILMGYVAVVSRSRRRA